MQDNNTKLNLTQHNETALIITTLSTTVSIFYTEREWLFSNYVELFVVAPIDYVSMFVIYLFFEGQISRIWPN